MLQCACTFHIDLQTSTNIQSLSVFFSEFSDHLEELLTLSSALCIIGDFNLHMDEPSKPEIVTFNDMLHSAGLAQHVSGPTHYKGQTLDRMVIRNSDNIIYPKPKVDFLISDHFSILADLNVPK